MLLEKLVEQHSVYRLIPHGIRLAVAITSYQVGVHLFYLLGHEPELRDALGVDLLLVAEGDRLEREDRFACVVHRLDLILESRRGRGRTELAVSIHVNGNST